MMDDLIRKIEEGSAIIGVVGLGYVGLPLAATFSKAFTVYGFDTDLERIESLKEGHSHTPDIPDDSLHTLSQTSFFPTSDEEVLAQCDFVVIAVPTPLKASKEPDLSFVVKAS